MSRLRHLLVLLLALGLLTTACGAPTGIAEPDEPDPTPAADPGEVDDADVADGPDTDERADDPVEGASEVTVHFVRTHDSGVWVEPETHELDEPTEAVAREAVQLLFTGTPHDPGLTSEAPSDVEVLQTNISDRVLIVDVSDEIRGHSAGSAGEIAFAEQLAHTGAAFDTVDAVRLWVEGEPIDELWGHLDWSQPVEPDPFALSPITVVEPPAGPGEVTVSTGAVVVRGEARVFEANFGIRLIGPDGTVVDDGFVTASTGAPERGTWEHTFTISEPGSYTIEVEEDDPSDGEGRPPFVSRREIEVAG